MGIKTKLPKKYLGLVKNIMGFMKSSFRVFNLDTEKQDFNKKKKGRFSYECY